MQKKSPQSDVERRRETSHFLISFPNQDYEAVRAKNYSGAGKKEEEEKLSLWKDIFGEWKKDLKVKSFAQIS